MANEITKVTDQNGIDHPFKDVAAFPRSEQAVLGAKNLWDDSDLRANYTTFTKTNNGYRVQSSQSDTYTYMASFFKLPDEAKGKNLIFSTNVTKTSGQNFIVVDASNDGTNFTKFFETDATGEVSRTYNCGSYSIYRVRFFVTLNTAAVGDVTFGDIMIRLATDTDPTYARYAMTNKELTDAVSVKNGLSSVTVIEGATLSANDSFLRKQNNVISAQLRVNGVTANSGANIATIPSGFIPSLTGGTVVFMSNASTGEMIPAYITINGYVRARTNLSSVDVNINFTYIAP